MSLPQTVMTESLANAFQEVLQIPFSTDNNGDLENGTFNLTTQQNVNCTETSIFQRSTITIGYTQNIVNPNYIFQGMS